MPEQETLRPRASSGIGQQYMARPAGGILSVFFGFASQDFGAMTKLACPRRDPLSFLPRLGPQPVIDGQG